MSRTMNTCSSIDWSRKGENRAMIMLRGACVFNMIILGSAEILMRGGAGSLFDLGE